MPSLRQSIVTSAPRRVVVKLGTGVLTSGIGDIDTDRIFAICDQIAALRARGTEVIIVSSGAIGLGMGRLGLKRRPRLVAQQQACAAIGQSLLMQTWQRAFDRHGATIAQVLLTHEDMRHRHRHLAVKASLESMIAYGTIPVVNENDTVSAAEIKVGDNDTLSAMVASLTHAEYLLILSTVEGLLDLRGSGKIVSVVKSITPRIEAMAEGTKSVTAVGGMVSKISAANLAARAGCGVFLAGGAVPNVITRIFSGHNPGTFFVAHGLPLESRKHWLAYFQRPNGQLQVDARAARALHQSGASLLAVGITGCGGHFAAGDIVDIADPDEQVVARGKTHFGHEHIDTIAGRSTDELRQLFPRRKRFEVVHRDHLVLL